jgi:uncharacterized caspase-like protein
MMRPWLGFLAAIAVTLATGAMPAQSATERRVALVIGNNDYQHATDLKNAVADARAFRRELEGRGFEVVFRENANRRAMNDAVEEFIGKLSTDAVSVIYYSGHGMQINSANYLIPIDLQAEKEADVSYDSVDLSRLIDRVSQAQARFTLAVIDACRDNPFARSGRSFGGGKGLAPPAGNAAGVMVVYSAGANQQALDKLNDADKDPNGVFTREFLKVMRQPGLSVQDAVNRVKMTVIERAKSVGHVQTPAIYDQSVGTFMFTPGTAEAANQPAPAPAPAPAPQNAQDIAAARAELAQVRAEQARLLAALEKRQMEVQQQPQQQVPIQQRVLVTPNSAPAPAPAPQQQAAVTPPPPTVQGPKLREWAVNVSRFDMARIGTYQASWDRAIASASREAPKAGADPVAIARRLWEAPKLDFTDSELAGNYRCRLVKVGGYVTVAYEWQPCRMGHAGQTLALEKTGGSQRTAGRLYRDNAKVMVYAGTWWAAGGKAAGYDMNDPAGQPDCNGYRNEVGLFYKVAAKHFVVGFPSPLCESPFAFMEVAAKAY